MRRGLAVVALLAGCSSFEDEDVVIDLRVLAMTASPPEQVVMVDPSMPPNPSALLAQLVPTEVCALIADPAFDRRVRYRFRLCMFGEGKRCDDDFITPFPAGFIEDPETAPLAQTKMCATVMPNGNLLAILTETIEGDILAALGGAEYIVELAVGGELDDPANDTFASKTLRVAPKIPVAREANINPTLMGLEVEIEKGNPIQVPFGRCVDQASPLEIRAGARIKVNPLEAATAREPYVVPTLDGRSMMFTESLTYQWLATAGGFSAGSTGGIRDAFGNYPELFTEYRAPSARDLARPTNVQLWIVQRDERYGATWYETCFRVVP